VGLWHKIGLTYDIYDDALAKDINQFLRGFNVAAVERRASAYSVILSTLRAFLAAPGRLDHAEDRSSARKLTENVVGRIMAEPPGKLSEKLSVFRLSWSVDKRAALRGLARQHSTVASSGPSA
jgi:hypothetical protein